MQISIVIPLYNKEKSIRSTLESVLAQTVIPDEIIVVNDGSTDKSVQILEEHFDLNQIQIIHQENSGVNAARNKGITTAINEWVVFLDADDLWNNNHLKVMKEMLENHPFEKIFTTSFSLSYAQESNKAFGIKVIDNYFEEVFNQEVLCSSCCMIHKSCFKEVGFFNEKLRRGEDLEMWYRLAKKYNIVKSDAKTAVYRIQAENRAMGKPMAYEYSFASVIDLSIAESPAEIRYLKNQIYRKYKSCLYNREWRNLWKCFQQHKLSFL